MYQLSYEIVGQTPATSYEIRLDVVQGTVNESEAVRFTELPPVDKQKFAARGWDNLETTGFGTSVPYTHAERNDSALVPDSAYSYIVWEDGPEAAWFVDDAHERTLYTYEYAAEQVSTAAEYGRRMLDQMAFELSGLSAEEAAIVQTAIDERAYAVEVGQTPSPAFWSLVDRFQGQEQTHGLDEEGEGDLSGSYLARYDGEVYWTLLIIAVERSGTESPA